MSTLDWKVSAIFAFTLWAGWALYVNFDAGLPSAILSSLTQGIISAFSITALSLSMDMILSAQWKNSSAKIVAAALIPYSVLLLIIIVSHIIVGTHDVLTTVLPSSSLGIIYSVLYSTKNANIKAV